jgi:hypothetical protein
MVHSNWLLSLHCTAWTCWRHPESRGSADARRDGRLRLVPVPRAIHKPALLRAGPVVECRQQNRIRQWGRYEKR